MREIKFRAWDKQENVMRSVLNLFANQHVYVDCQCAGKEKLKYHSDKTRHNFSHHISPKNYELMQYTGLLDKNGKEIYEGDIMRYRNENSGRVGEPTPIVWRDGRFWFDDGKTNCFGRPSFSKNFEVIGDIYTTPELLQN